MVRTLEIPEEEPETVDAMETENGDTVPGSREDDSHKSSEPALPELTDEQKIEAYIRKEQVLRDAQTELVNLEHTVADLRREINGYKEPIADARAKVARLISCDVHGFLKWEQEQELPLLRKAEAAANAWRYESVEKLDVTEKDKEHLQEHFANCGSVADWLCLDFPDKKKGLNGEATKERLRTAIAKISGTETKTEPAAKAAEQAA